MGLFTNGKQYSLDKDSPQYIATKFNNARSTIIIGVLFTVINIIIALCGGDTEFLFSFSYPYYNFDISDPVSIVVSVLILAFLVVCFLLTKKKCPYLLIGAFVVALLDTIFFCLVAYETYLYVGKDVTFSLILDGAFHIWLLAGITIGIFYIKKYKATILDGGLNPYMPIKPDENNDFSGEDEEK